MVHVTTWQRAETPRAGHPDWGRVVLVCAATDRAASDVRPKQQDGGLMFRSNRSMRALAALVATAGMTLAACGTTEDGGSGGRRRRQTAPTAT